MSRHHDIILIGGGVCRGRTRKTARLLSAFAEDHGRKAVDECEGGPSEAWRAEEGASADCAEEMKDTTGASPWRLHVADPTGHWIEVVAAK